MKSRRPLRVAAALCLAVTLAGCGLIGRKEALKPCPEFLIVGQGGELIKFVAGPGRDLTDVLFETKIVDFAGSCEHDDDTVSVTMSIDFSIERGPANRDRRAGFEYFVAIPKFYPAPQGKRVLPVRIEFKGNQTRIVFRDELELEIPLQPGEVGADYEVFLGFQLTPDELEYNRRRRPI